MLKNNFGYLFLWFFINNVAYQAANPFPQACCINTESFLDSLSFTPTGCDESLIKLKIRIFIKALYKKTLAESATQEFFLERDPYISLQTIKSINWFFLKKLIDIAQAFFDTAVTKDISILKSFFKYEYDELIEDVFEYNDEDTKTKLVNTDLCFLYSYLIMLKVLDHYTNIAVTSINYLSQSIKKAERVPVLQKELSHIKMTPSNKGIIDSRRISINNDIFIPDYFFMHLSVVCLFIEECRKFGCQGGFEHVFFINYEYKIDEPCTIQEKKNTNTDFIKYVICTQITTQGPCTFSFNNEERKEHDKLMLEHYKPFAMNFFYQDKKKNVLTAFIESLPNHKSDSCSKKDQQRHASLQPSFNFIIEYLKSDSFNLFLNEFNKKYSKKSSSLNRKHDNETKDGNDQPTLESITTNTKPHVEDELISTYKEPDNDEPFLEILPCNITIDEDNIRKIKRFYQNIIATIDKSTTKQKAENLNNEEEFRPMVVIEEAEEIITKKLSIPFSKNDNIFKFLTDYYYKNGFKILKTVFSKKNSTTLSSTLENDFYTGLFLIDNAMLFCIKSAIFEKEGFSCNEINTLEKILCKKIGLNPILENPSFLLSKLPSLKTRIFNGKPDDKINEYLKKPNKITISPNYFVNKITETPFCQSSSGTNSVQGLFYELKKITQDENGTSVFRISLENPIIFIEEYLRQYFQYFIFSESKRKK